ncbi:MAG: DUF342 domain-containing protein [Deltaproteobacteria bacterium]
MDANIPIENLVKVTVDRDKMKANLVVLPPGENGQVATLEQAQKAIADAGVTYGIRENKIREALMEVNWGFEMTVAEGEPAVNGEDAKVTYHFQLPSQQGGPKMDEKGNVDYFDLGLINNVKAGQLLAERVPPTEGTIGHDVFGNEIQPRRGKDNRLLRGTNSVIDQEETAIYSVIDGHVSLVGNKIQVNPVFHVKGNVDYATGNIDFIGNVVIAGNVASGFKVKAGGDIEVGGFIEGAEVEAGGSVIVKGGIAGGTKGKVAAGENVMARFAENSHIEAGSDILIKEAIMQSNLKAGGSVRVSSNKAIIVGGLIQATHEVEARVLGSQLATQTIIEVGVNPAHRDEYHELIRVRTEKKKIMDNLNQNLQAFQRSGISMENLSDKKKADLIKMLDYFKSLHQELTQMEKRVVQLEAEFQRTQNAKVRVLDVAYPGVRISIGQAIYIVNDMVKYCEFIMDRGEVRMGSLR